MSRPLMTITVVLSALVGLSRESAAASYGSYTDPTGSVSYQNVQDVNGLFGAPSVSLDSLDFSPTQFEAVCTQCPSGVSTSDTLSLEIQAIPGKEITQLEISEGLDYSLQSFDVNGIATVQVTASLSISVLELNGVAVSGISSNVLVSFSPLTPISVVGFGIQSGIILGSTGAIDVQQMIANAGATGDATRIGVSFGNTLVAIHDGAGGQASIRKRDADFVSLTAIGGLINTPEPSTAVLVMGGLALLSRRRRPD